MTMQPWFADAKLGIFLHWGIYAVRGVTESWSFYFGEISYPDYMDQMAEFKAENFDPDAWADLFKRAGARYAVLTAKHHDGVALWDTKAPGGRSLAATVGRDLLGEFSTAMHRNGLKTGFYFSHLDWSHPDYPTMRPATLGKPWMDSRFGMAPPGEEDPDRWENFLRFHRAQVFEVIDGYRPDLMWFDGAWERDDEQWRMAELRDQIAERAPQMIVSRLMGHSDYQTPEQGQPVIPPDGPWELCMTLNDSWGYRESDTAFKSPRELVRIFAETIGGGGNLLLGIGPRADGTFSEEYVRRLEALGGWIRRNHEAVHGTGTGLQAGHHYGPSTLANDRRTLYLICLDPPVEFTTVKGLCNRVVDARVLGTGEDLAYKVVGGFGEEVPGTLYIDAPSKSDSLATVIALELDGELDVYRGQGGHG